MSGGRKDEGWESMHIRTTLYLSVDLRFWSCKWNSSVGYLRSMNLQGCLGLCGFVCHIYYRFLFLNYLFLFLEHRCPDPWFYIWKDSWFYFLKSLFLFSGVCSNFWFGCGVLPRPAFTIFFGAWLYFWKSLLLFLEIFDSIFGNTSLFLEFLFLFLGTFVSIFGIFVSIFGIILFI